MRAIEFTTELRGEKVLQIPGEVAEQLPKSGLARIIVLTQEDAEDSGWRQLSYGQFLRDNPPEDAIYDAIK
jgi:hypothetical protein